MCTNVSSGDAGKVLPESVRHVLTGQHQTQDSGAERRGFCPLPRRGHAVSNARIDRLRAEDPE